MKWLVVFVLLVFTCKVFAMDFPCQKMIEETESYVHCANKVPRYSLPFHFFYPKNLDVNKEVFLDLHFHGHNLEGYSHFYKTSTPGEGWGDFGNFLLMGNLNGVLIVPESYGNCKNFDEEFKNEANAINIINELSSISQYENQKWLFSGHSGAYRVLRRIFSIENLEKKIDLEIGGVALIDATYSDISSIVNFTKNKDEKFVFFDSYVDGSKGTTTELNSVINSKYKNQPHFYIFPVNSTSEAVLDQHFKLIARKGLVAFFQIINSQNQSN